MNGCWNWLSKQLLVIGVCSVVTWGCRTAEMGRGSEEPASSATGRETSHSSIDQGVRTPLPRVKVEILQAIPVSLDQNGVMTKTPKILLDTLSRPRIDGVTKVQCAVPFDPDQIVAQLQCASPITQTSPVRAHAFDQICGIETEQLKAPSNGRPQIAGCASDSATLQIYTLDSGLRVE
jgi:hypothetical protein